MPIRTLMSMTVEENEHKEIYAFMSALTLNWAELSIAAADFT